MTEATRSRLPLWWIPTLRLRPEYLRALDTSLPGCTMRRSAMTEITTWSIYADRFNQWKRLHIFTVWYFYQSRQINNRLRKMFFFRLIMSVGQRKNYESPVPMRNPCICIESLIPLCLSLQNITSLITIIINRLWKGLSYPSSCIRLVTAAYYHSHLLGR